MTSGAYGTTSGSDTRDARALISDMLVFSLQAEIDALREEEPYRAGDRNSATLAKEVDFRVLLSVLRTGAVIDEADGDARTSIQLLDGTATLSMDEAEADLATMDLAVVDTGKPWVLRATSDCAVLLTFAWPREKAGV